ncbi:MAG: CusA/CzcA family heavy metal efflux RND transporter [Chitinophagaceae bacterium]|nr:MAG: CusA/CzcA family heavy metal efflux RND transporter [Chitinophagaceae bacterium]
MLDKIIRFSIKNKLVIAAMTIILVAWGIWSATKLPIDAVPDITNNQVQIITTVPPKEGSEDKYSAMDLRTMQDWIVARQLYGTPGVAEVNSFGGMLKQYEVAVDPNRLKALNVSIAEIYEALEKNNQNTGGAYIDKKPNAYFIRGIGLITSLEEIGKIVVKNVNGIPVLISDVATPRFGNAIRYGAMTHNGEHEVVGGIVMMLKGSNSAEVVKRVKEKMETIKKSLPADIEIEPFLDRTNLVNRAIATVEKNLVEGALIVIFVLVLFLGNLRAGLIVASAIPLSMLFALGMMNVFGVSANLMSLGAIDFGLIVDGAVIIVEATMHHLGLRKRTEKLTQSEMDAEVYESASKIRSSAAFGEIIILIVYLPILTLVGIEGKMFRPMAQTVGFAILGALILSLTYIPMMCARFLPKQVSHKRNISDRMMDFFQRLYSPAIHWAIKLKYVVVAAATALLVITGIIFSRMGAEFIPQLQEGDYAFHCILPQGSSLSQSIETSMQASRIIKSFPEVKDVVGKTGSAEVPTDPMPPEASDLIITLKDKDEWTTTDDYNELSRMMEEKLEAIPGVFFEANQPIQMRFNELMTGVRQDVAVKIFGENIDTLAALAPRIASIIQSVEGVTEPQIERTTGLPQITIEYDRGRIASYGMNIEDVNRVVSTAFAGQSAGVVFENERKFDLVVRLDTANRNSIEDVANLFIPTADGAQIPLSQVATVSFKEGPSQISREDAKRRVVIGFNVQDRDVQSVVQDIQAKLSAQNILPTGYYFTYGGTFENLEQASARLSIAVPIALLLIFALLYFTFGSVKQAALIFTAIPMSAIGGVFALLLRGMPFSISAGVGFIALFGVAVLNGIVLIGQFNHLAKEGITDPIQRVLEGTKIRLRPVLMTATVASLGFLPMAISTGAGAEVQKPLATVVIGGLITATVLTLFVLPLLYIIFSGKMRPNKTIQKVAPVIALLFVSQIVFAQPTGQTIRTSFDAVYDTALRTNLQLRAADMQVQRGRTLISTGGELPRTGFFVENEDLSPGDPNGVLKIGISQSLEWPGVYRARRNLLEQQLTATQLSRQLRALEIKRDVQGAYYTIWYLQNRQQLFTRLDSIYRSLANAARLKVRTGESAGLDSIAAIARSREITVQVHMLNRDIAAQQEVLRRLTNTGYLYLPPLEPLEKVNTELLLDTLRNHPAIQLQLQNTSIAAAEVNVQQQGVKPNFEGRFFSQRLYSPLIPERVNGQRNLFSGFSVSANFPIFNRSAVKNRIRAAEQERDYQQSLVNYEIANLSGQYYQAIQQLRKDEEMLNFYETTGLAQADAIIKAANISYRAGEISFADLSQFLTQAIDIQRNYLEVLNQYNQSAIQANYYLNR